MPSDSPVRSASSSIVSGCLPCARCQVPWPNAGTTLPSPNVTVRASLFGSAPSARAGMPGTDASIALTPGSDSPSPAQRRLNSRRRHSFLFVAAVSIIGAVAGTGQDIIRRSELATAIVRMRHSRVHGDDTEGTFAGRAVVTRTETLCLTLSRFQLYAIPISLIRGASPVTYRCWSECGARGRDS